MAGAVDVANGVARRRRRIGCSVLESTSGRIDRSTTNP
jgi:hypothetical protein